MMPLCIMLNTNWTPLISKLHDAVAACDRKYTIFTHVYTTTQPIQSTKHLKAKQSTTLFIIINRHNLDTQRHKNVDSNKHRSKQRKQKLIGKMRNRHRGNLPKLTYLWLSWRLLLCSCNMYSSAMKHNGNWVFIDYLRKTV